MGSGASAFEKKRYMGGKVFPKFYREDTWPAVEDLFETLGISQERGYAIFQVFATIDQDEDGFITTQEIIDHFVGQRTKFTDRIFYTERPYVFSEFTIALWQYCTMTSAHLARFIFEIFDIDQQYQLEKAHVRTMYKMVYKQEEIEEEYLLGFPFDGPDEIITKEDFILAVCGGKQSVIGKTSSTVDDPTSSKGSMRLTHLLPGAKKKKSYAHLLILPASRYQRLLRKRCGGQLMWMALTSHREVHFAEQFDNRYDTLADSQTHLLQHAADRQVLRRQQTDTTHLLQMKSEEVLTTKEQLQLELVKTRRLSAAVLPPGHSRKGQTGQGGTGGMGGAALVMARSWLVYDHRRKEFEAFEYTVAPASVTLRQADRQALFALLDEAVRASLVHDRLSFMYRLQVTIGTPADHEARLTDYLLTDEGKGLEKLTMILHVLRMVYTDILTLKNKKKEKALEHQGAASPSPPVKVNFNEATKSDKEVLTEQALKDCSKLLEEVKAAYSLLEEREEEELTKIIEEDDLQAMEEEEVDEVEDEEVDEEVDEGEDEERAAGILDDKEDGLDVGDTEASFQAAIGRGGRGRGGGSGNGSANKRRPGTGERKSRPPSSSSALAINTAQQRPMSPIDLLKLQSAKHRQRAVSSSSPTAANNSSKRAAVGMGSLSYQLQQKRKKQQQQLQQQQRPLSAGSNPDQGKEEQREPMPQLTEDEKKKRLILLGKRDMREEWQLAKKYGSKKQWTLAAQLTHDEIFTDLRARTIHQMKRDLVKEKEERRREFIRKDWDFTTTHGSRFTAWEYVLDPETNKTCYVHNQSFVRRHPKTAICEHCDAIMVQHELRCIQCDHPRSAKNLKLYRPLGFKDITME